MKKTVTLVSSILSFVLALVLALMLVLPVVSIDTGAVEIDEKFTNGYYTSQLDYPETCEVGLGLVIDYITYGYHVDYILKVQYLYEEIDRIKAEAFGQSAADAIANRTQEIADLMEAYGDAEEHAKLADMLANDEKFINVLAAVTLNRTLGTNKSNKSLGTQSVLGDVYDLRGVMVMLFFVVVLILTGIAAIIAFINAIVALVRFLKNVKHLGEANAFASLSRSAGTAVLVIPFLGVLYYAYSAGSAVAPSAWLIIALVAVLVNALLRAVVATLSQPNNDAVIKCAIKNGITLVALVALILTTVCLFNVNVLDNVEEHIEDAQDSYYNKLYTEYLEAELAAGKGPINADSNARDKAEIQSYKDFSADMPLIYVAAFVFQFFVIIAAACLAGRLGQSVMTSKYGTPSVYGQMIVLAVIILALTILPILNNVSTLEARTENDLNGSYSVLYDAYRHEGTREYAKHETAVSERDLAKEFYDVAKEEYDELDSPTEEETRVLLSLKNAYDIAEARVDSIETRENVSKIFAVILAVIFLGAEIAYKVTPDTSYSRILTTSKCFVVESDAPAEAPVAEAPVAEAPVAEANEE